MSISPNQLHWSDSDEFWEKTYPFEFDDKRFASAPREIDGLLRLVNVPAPAHILDLCCGPGRHAIELAKRGYDVTGVDRTAFYIDIARQSATRANLNVNFQVADARTFVQSRSFDLVLNLFTSFGYFKTEAEDREMLHSAYESLRPGGQLVIETLNSNEVIKTVHATSRREHPSGVLLEDSTLSKDRRILSTHWTLLPNSGQESGFDFTLRLYSHTELQRLLEKVGLNHISKFAGFSGAPFTGQSARILIVATKAQDL